MTAVWNRNRGKLDIVKYDTFLLFVSTGSIIRPNDCLLYKSKHDYFQVQILGGGHYVTGHPETVAW